LIAAMISIRRCDSGQRRAGRPGFELVAFVVTRIEHVLCDQGRFEAERLGLQDKALVAFPSGVGRVFGMEERSRGTVNLRPNAEARM
jgi:hypothetical protein